MACLTHPKSEYESLQFGLSVPAANYSFVDHRVLIVQRKRSTAQFDYLRQKISITDEGHLERIAEALIPLIKSDSSSQLANDVLQAVRFSPWSKDNINEFAEKLASSMVENDIDEETDAGDYKQQALDTIQALLTRLHEALDTNKTPLNQSEVEQAKQFLELVAERENVEPETTYLKMLINQTRTEPQ
ncbi:hypothetical protein MCEMAEM21_02320 [Oxalobacteraceae bacterium]